MHQETPHWPSPDISGRFSAIHILFPIQSQQCIQQGKHRQPYFKSKAAGADINRIYPRKSKIRTHSPLGRSSDCLCMVGRVCPKPCQERVQQSGICQIKPKCLAIISQTSSLVSFCVSCRTTAKNPLLAYSS